MPGHANTVSVTTAKAIMEPSSRPITVTTGIRITLSTCTPMMRTGRRPLARAKRTKSCSSASRVPA